MSANGYLTPAELVTVQAGIQLSVPTAAAWSTMKAAAAVQGVTLTIVPPAGGYRSWATQLDMRANPKRYNITPGIRPGLPSEHGFGTCVDVGGGLAWVIANGARFGFTRPLSNDPNHFRHDGITAAGTGTPIQEQGDEMYLLKNTKGAHRLITSSGTTVLNNQERDLIWRMLTLPEDTMLDAELDIIHAAIRRTVPAAVGGSADLGPVLDAVAGLKIPTAVENGQAARAAIVK